MKNINVKEEKNKKEPQVAENSSPIVFENFKDLGFSASFNNSREKIFKENVKESIYSNFGIEIIENNEEQDTLKLNKRNIATKKINRKEAKEFNKKYRQNLYKKINSEKNDLNKKQKKTFFNKIKKFLNFNKTPKDDILPKDKKIVEIEKKINFEIEKEQKIINKLYKDKIRKEKVDEFKTKTNEAFNTVKENSVEFSKNVIDTTKKQSIKFYLKNIKDTVNRRINILNILVIVPILILLSINIKLVKDIFIAQRAIDNANKYRKHTIQLQNETEKIQEEINKIKKELKD